MGLKRDKPHNCGIPMKHWDKNGMITGKLAHLSTGDLDFFHSMFAVYYLIPKKHVEHTIFANLIHWFLGPCLTSSEGSSNSPNTSELGYFGRVATCGRYISARFRDMSCPFRKKPLFSILFCVRALVERLIK
jgi:hypothetical protein